MKISKLLLLASLIALFSEANAQVEFKIITSIESIVPMGLGRSRIIENNGGANADELTTERTEGVDSRQSAIKRNEVKIDELNETKLLNLFSLGGINFRNIASNDAVIASKLNLLTQQGWELAYVTSAVESNAGKDDGEGIFITRFIFRRSLSKLK
ncbi:MAG: hypothetical protein FJY19_05210 [Bacteroidetes bacterium]|nr:hypothetical protein [Bacteroidota bacterium]